MESKFEVVVDDSSAGERLDKFLGRLEEIGSRSRAAALLTDQRILVNGKHGKASHILKAGDNLEVSLPTQQDASEITPLSLALDIVFEDADLLVVNKPAGLVVHPAVGHANDTLVNALVHHTADLSMGFGEKRPGIVHRLDRDTSGLIVIAKNDAAHKMLAEQFKKKTTHRVYWAVVYGDVKQESGRFESLLARHPKDRKRFASNAKSGKRAITHFTVVKKSPLKQLTLVKLQLETGRTHQIRVHLSEAGHPIVGDIVYGGSKGVSGRTKTLKSSDLVKYIESMPRFALHAAELGFVHPRTKEELKFTSEWPSDLKPLLEYAQLL